MVDAIVSFAVQRLNVFLSKEAVFLHKEVQDEVKSLTNELNFMLRFLKDAEQKQDCNNSSRVWVSEIQDIAYETQDVIETFIFKANKGRIQTSKQQILSNYVKNFFGISTTANRYGIGKEIKALNNRLLEVKSKRETYGINNIGGGVQEGASSIAGNLRDLRTTPYADEEDVIGFEDDAQSLQAKLFLKQSRRTVISILGMGGLGKTTLARKLYNNNKTEFTLHAWVCVSQEWNPRDLLERLIKSFKGKLTKDDMEMLEKMKDYDMEEYLRDLLQGHKYLVVIDDMCQKEAWQSLRRALPDNQNGSRIIITTRKESVAEVSDETHKLRFLRKDESWQLFCKKAFPENSGACPPDMETRGKQMVAKSNGLPLAIIVLGGLLSRKQFHEWHVVKERIWKELKNDSSYNSSLLDLSYKDLPHELKSCFLYLSLFPEDSIIDAEKVTRMWVAEQFITPKEGGLDDLEEVAENYLKELIRRSLIQVVKRNWRMVSTFRVHDLLRDLAVDKARKLNLFQIHDRCLNSAPSSATSSYRRLAAGPQTYVSLDRSYPNLRTLLFCESHSVGTTDWLASIQTRFRLLRVLDLEGANFDPHGKLMLPDAVGELIHLRYLGLNDTNIVALPECIGNLLALQTLHASSHTEMKLPRELCKLKQLRHLRGHFSAPTFLYEDLTDLVSLKFIEIGSWIRKEEGKFALHSIAKLGNLRSFSVLSRTFMLSITPLLDCQHLMELRVHGRIGKLPEDMHICLSHLMYLELKDSGFEQDPMPSLAMFEDLIVLELQDIGVKHITCSATGFLQLEVFKLICKLGKLQMHEEAMPRLKAISIFTDVDDKSYAHILPERLASLPAVAELNWESESLC